MRYAVEKFTKQLRILRYVNWWIFLDCIIKINPRKLAIKKHLEKIYMQMQDRTFGQKNIVKKPETQQNAAKTNKLMKRYNE